MGPSRLVGAEPRPMLRDRWFADSPVEEGVSSELVSENQNSLLAGKIQGNRSILASHVQISHQKYG
jgi:hypothetical protein